MLGATPNAAKYAGLDAKKQIVIMMIIGALLGGFSGAVEVMGLKRRVYMEFVTNVGYESVGAVALLAGGNPLGVIFSALFFAALKAGGATMSIETGVISAMNSIIIAMCMLFVIGVGVVDSRRMNKVVDTSEKTTRTRQKILPQRRVTEMTAGMIIDWLQEPFAGRLRCLSLQLE